MNGWYITINLPNDWTVWLKPALFLIFGIGIATLGINGFLIPNAFIDGGITGISMLLSNVTPLNLGAIIAVINIPFISIGYKRIGLLFAIKSSIAIGGFAVALHYSPVIPLTAEPILAAVFGGFLVGSGIGLAVRAGAVLDGTEITAILISKKLDLKIGDIILIINSLVFSLGAVYLGLDIALYSVITYMAASKAADFIIYGFDSLGVTIISLQSDSIRRRIITELNLGVTIYNGQRGTSHHAQDIVFCVCSSLDIPKLRTLVMQIDPKAFIHSHKIINAYGGFLKQW